MVVILNVNRLFVVLVATARTAHHVDRALDDASVIRLSNTHRPDVQPAIHCFQAARET